MKKKINRILFLLLSIYLMLGSASATTLLVPVGKAIGLELTNNSVTIADFDGTLGKAAKDAGLQVGDRILSVNRQGIQCPQDVRKALDGIDGTAEITILRGSETKTVSVTPNITKDGPKLGIFLKAGITGVGTVTWYDPEAGTFGALGHGVNTPDGQLTELKKGTAYSADILSVQKGKAGQPGQLLGSMNGAKPIGELSKNTPQGVFGSTKEGWQGEKIPIAQADEIKKGPAIIRSTIEGQTPQEYSVEILKIYPSSGISGRNMLLRVTDPKLLETTGGIVQGMSGSPIIQDGKLVGAVTHVLVNDPCTGYGIFIENMLDAAA